MAASTLGGISLTLTAGGEIIRTTGLVINVGTDFYEGNTEKAIGRLTLEVLSGVFGKKLEKAFPKASKSELN